MSLRYYIFLKDVFVLATNSFGGPQAHISLFLQRMVENRRYITESELMELNALCQILPGPTSSQTIVAIGFKVGGPKLAFLTLLVWTLPAILIMTMAGILISYLPDLSFTKFIQPIAVGFVAYAFYKISSKVVQTKLGIVIMVFSALTSYFFHSPYLSPLLLILGGSITAFKYQEQPIEEKGKLHVEWSNFILWASVFILAAVLGGVTKWLPLRLFENFYRNGSLVFGGGQVLIPLMYTEFVEFKKHYLTSDEFLSGYALVQAVPGPVFSISSYIGALAMRDHGILGQIAGGLFSGAGIFLPGTFLIFFVVRFWDGFKKYRIVKASLEGVKAVSSGMVASAAVLMFEPLNFNIINISLIASTLALLIFTKIPFPFIIIAGLLAGFIF